MAEVTKLMKVVTRWLNTTTIRLLTIMLLGKRQVEPLLPISVNQTQFGKFLNIGSSSVKQDLDSQDLSKNLPVECKIWLASQNCIA
jgi:hypothetical protein